MSSPLPASAATQPGPCCSCHIHDRLRQPTNHTTPPDLQFMYKVCYDAHVAEPGGRIPHAAVCQATDPKSSSMSRPA